MQNNYHIVEYINLSMFNKKWSTTSNLHKNEFLTIHIGFEKMVERNILFFIRLDDYFNLQYRMRMLFLYCVYILFDIENVTLWQLL